MPELQVTLTVNGHKTTIKTEPHHTLLHVLRDILGLTGPKDGCGQGDCGACIVVMNGQAVNSCLVLAPQAEGAEVITVEGLAPKGSLHALQHHFIEEGIIQCGYCTPGMLMSCYALLCTNRNPTPADIRTAISGNLCRCTGYQAIVEAVCQAAAEVREEKVGM